MYKTISSDEAILNPAYGVGFYFSMINAALFCLLIPAVYLMVSSDGVIQDKPRPKSRQVRSMMFASKSSMSTMSSVKSANSKISPGYSPRSYGDTMRSERSTTTSESSSSYSGLSKKSLPTSDRYYKLREDVPIGPSKLVPTSERGKSRNELPNIPARTFKSTSRPNKDLKIKTEYSTEYKNASPEQSSTERSARRTRTTGARTADEVRSNRRGLERKAVTDGGRKRNNERPLKSAPEVFKDKGRSRDIELATFDSTPMDDFDDFLKSFEK